MIITECGMFQVRRRDLSLTLGHAKSDSGGCVATMGARHSIRFHDMHHKMTNRFAEGIAYANGFSISANWSAIAFFHLDRRGGSPAEPSVGLINTTLGPLNTTRPNCLDGSALSERGATMSIIFMQNERVLLTLVLLYHVVHDQIHQLVEAFQCTGD